MQPLPPLLNLWSGYSLLRSVWRMDVGLAELASVGYRDVGLADLETLAGVERFDRLARQHGLRPWIGLSLWVGPDIAQVFALSLAGYQTLCRAVARPRQWDWNEGALDQLLVIGSDAVLTQLADRGLALLVEGVEPGAEPSDRARAGQRCWTPSWPVRYHGPADREAYAGCLRLGGYPRADGRGVPQPEDWARAYPQKWPEWFRAFAPPRVLPDYRPHIPRLEASPATEARQLWTMATNGLHRRYPEDQWDAAKARLRYEMIIIEKLGFSGYFLLVADLVAHARQRGIRVGPGRGSAAGSLVAYCLGITHIEPLAHRLIFERFLNPERQNLPDIDIDFAYDRRAELLPYLQQRWGFDAVSQIGVYGSFGPRQALRDAGRILGLDSEAIARGMEAAAVDPSRGLEGQLPPHRPWDPLGHWGALALQLEGLPRHFSVHAAGVIVAPGPLWQWTACVPGHDGWVSQMEMASLERLGLVKFDLLGLRTLSVAHHIETAMGLPGEEEAVDAADALTLRLLSQGETEGVFQLDSPGVKTLLRELRPRHRDDVMDVVALYRPGPMDAIPTYLQRRLHPSGDEDDRADPLCRRFPETFGVLVYQEQLMELVRELGGCSWAQADVYRRAISKKDRSLMRQLQTDLVAAFLREGMTAAAADALCQRILAFADYGFNRSHAAAYGSLAYYVAYLKAHYPLMFWSAELTSRQGHHEQVALEIGHVASLGASLAWPDVNASDWEFTAVTDGLRVGLGALRGVPKALVDEILRARRQDGPFRDFADFWRRTGHRFDDRIRTILEQSGILAGLPGFRGGQRRQLDWFQEAELTSATIRLFPQRVLGWDWPVAVGPIYVRCSVGAAISETLPRIEAWAQAHPGPMAVVVVLNPDRGHRLPHTVAGQWADLEVLRALPGIESVRRRIRWDQEVSLPS